MNPDMDRVMLWRMNSSDALGGMTAWFGCLEDGTVFQKLGGQPWKTVIKGPSDIDKSFALVIEMTRRNEEHMTMTGPVEFSVGQEAADSIRWNTDWQGTELVLTIGFDMAVRAAAATNSSRARFGR